MSDRSNDGLPELEIVEGEVLEEPAAGLDDLELPDDPEQAIEVLKAEVSRARGQAAEQLERLQRVAAEFDNFRKRSLRELAETNQRAAERVVADLLPALDSFDAALAVEPSSEAEEKLLAGLRRTHEQLMTILAAHGLEVVSTVGEPFDPGRHEAVMSPSEGGALVVGQELRRGYILKDRLVRAALVALERAG